MVTAMAIAMLRRRRWTCSPLPLSRRTRPLPRDGSSRPHAYLMVGCGLTGRPPGIVAHGQPHRQPHWHERAVAERAVRGGVLPSSSWGTNRDTRFLLRGQPYGQPPDFSLLRVCGMVLRHGILRHGILRHGILRFPYVLFVGRARTLLDKGL